MSGHLIIGSVIGGRYRVDRQVGEGGMQYVYAALDQMSGRTVALKTPKNDSATKRFKRSAILSAKVNHPNVAKTLDYLKVDNLRFLIEEFIEGEDLAQALLDAMPFADPHLAAKVFHHLAKGIAAAHHVGVVHRDLKPTNVMVTGGLSIRELKITDFGIAKMAAGELDEAAEGGTATMTTSQTAVGALPYMAPEAIESPKTVTCSADVWSIGAMLYHILCGEPPYGSGLKAVKTILEAKPPVAPNFLGAKPQFRPLAEEVLKIALACLKKDPTARPTADTLIAECEKLCYSVTLRETGTVRRHVHTTCGFLHGDADGRDIFFHQDSVYGTANVEINDSVVFSRHDGGGAPRAHPVVKLKRSVIT